MNTILKCKDILRKEFLYKISTKFKPTKPYTVTIHLFSNLTNLLFRITNFQKTWFVYLLFCEQNFFKKTKIF